MISANKFASPILPEALRTAWVCTLLSSPTTERWSKEYCLALVKNSSTNSSDTLPPISFHNLRNKVLEICIEGSRCAIIILTVIL